MHQIIETFATLNNQQGQYAFNTIHMVAAWEKDFAKRFIKPAISELERNLARHRKAVKEDKEEASNVLLDIVHEEPGQLADKSKILSLSQVWQPRDEITLERLESKLGGPVRFKDQCPLLFHLVKDEQVLKELTHLPQLLRLASFITENFNRKFDTGEADSITVETFLMTHCGAGDRQSLRPLVNTYLAVFNRLKGLLYAFNWYVPASILF